MWGLGRSSISVAHRVDDLEKLSKAFNDHLRVAHRVDDLEIACATARTLLKVAHRTDDLEIAPFHPNAI